MITKESVKIKEHCYNLIVRDGNKIVYNNLCDGIILKRRKDCDIAFKKFKKSYAPNKDI